MSEYSNKKTEVNITMSKADIKLILRLLKENYKDMSNINNIEKKLYYRLKTTLKTIMETN